MMRTLQLSQTSMAQKHCGIPGAWVFLTMQKLPQIESAVPS